MSPTPLLRGYPHQWALAHYELARLHAWYMPEAGQARITRALDHCRQAITGWTRAGRAVGLANARDLMGTLYRHQLEGDRQENLQQGLHYHQAALDMLEAYRRTEALAWSRVQHNIGTTLFQTYDLSAGSPDLLDKALVHFQNALAVRQRQTYPDQWAATQHNMAVIYLIRPHGQRAASIALIPLVLQNRFSIGTGSCSLLRLKIHMRGCEGRQPSRTGPVSLRIQKTGLPDRSRKAPQ